MAPKKQEGPEKKPLIGRIGTNLKIGIVGLPNAGKSTFFNVLTKSQAAAENFPFCTIDPNENKYLKLHIRFQHMASLTVNCFQQVGYQFPIPDLITWWNITNQRGILMDYHRENECSLII